MIATSFTTYIVDDDPSILKALERLLRGAGYDVKTFVTPDRFLSEHDPTLPGCAIVDVSMPDLDGFALQQKLMQDDVQRPIIFLTGFGSIPMSVQAMRAGAIDFLTKPVQRDALLAAVTRARDREIDLRRARAINERLDEKLKTLTPRERQVLTHVVKGRLNKQIAADLGTVEKTIKVHRARMMQKMGVRTVADLVRMVERVNADTARSIVQDDRPRP